MDLSILIKLILEAPILFFLLGALAIFIGSDLKMPDSMKEILSIYLLFVIGLKGGDKLSASPLDHESIMILISAMVASVVVPLYAFFMFRWKLNMKDAAASAATYGSISAVTFILTGVLLNGIGIKYSPSLVAAMALMEVPAIIISIILVRLLDKESTKVAGWGTILHEAFFSGPILLLIGSLIIGYFCTKEALDKLKPFTYGVFPGALCFYMLDMGLSTAKRFPEVRHYGKVLISYAIFLPVLNAILAIAAAYWLKFSIGNAVLFTMLCCSASYVAVPAAMSKTLPESNPTIYVGMALGITFPFNVLIGLPIYFEIIQLLWK